MKHEDLLAAPEKDCLQNKILLVTGAGNGIGKAVSIACATYGATVILLDKDLKALEKTYDEIEQAGLPQAAIYPLNLSGATPNDYETLANTIAGEFKRLDGILHNAAYFPGLMPMDQITPEVWHEAMQANISGPFFLTQACLPLLLETSDSQLVFTQDEFGIHPKAYWGSYAVSKAAVTGLMELCLDEFSHRGLYVNTIIPGPTRTKLRRLAYPGENPEAIQTPESISNVYVQLFRNKAEHQGQTITLAGS